MTLGVPGSLVSYINSRFDVASSRSCCDGLSMNGFRFVPVSTPFALSVSKGERRLRNGLYEKRIGIMLTLA
jgi:hypothetical protein